MHRTAEVVETKNQQEKQLQKKELNGLNLEQFQSTIKIIKQRPEAGMLTFHTLSRSDEGFAVDGRTSKIEIIDRTNKRKFKVRGDRPPELLVENTGPTAIGAILSFQRYNKGGQKT